MSQSSAWRSFDHTVDVPSRSIEPGGDGEGLAVPTLPGTVQLHSVELCCWGLPATSMRGGGLLLATLLLCCSAWRIVRLLLMPLLLF